MTTTLNPQETQAPRRRLPNWMTSFGWQVFIGLIVGLVLGFAARGAAEGNWLSTSLSAIGSTYVQLLKLLIPPLVFAAVVTSIANLRKVTNAARLAVSTLVWFAITAFFSVLVGIGVALILQPGSNTSIDPATAADPSRTGSWLGFIQSIVPANILGLSAAQSSTGAIALNFNVLQILVLSLAIGIAAVRSGKAAEPFLAFTESFLKIIQEVLWWIIRLAPIGTAALIGNAVASYGWEALGSLGKFVFAIYVGLALVIGVIYPVVLRFVGIPVTEFFRRVWPVTSLGFVTRSSMGVMPVTQRVAEENLGVPREYASFAVPLGATTKMDGCAAVYPAVAAIFVAQFYGIPLGFTDYLLIIFVSVIGSAATAGTTGATVMLTLTLSTLGLPLAGVGLLLAIEPIIDMGRTAVNVTGQALIPAVVAKRAGILNEEVWQRELKAAVS
ncbi:dicarboxylate/amino acid:cation symporter [Corynebacterium kutscheri]|uniref:Na(+)/H(+)-dicarboxylate symporter family protein n=1 Tax=Corynebacterium kutscheri TaxID=35755 RepID=A0AB38VQB2_9CORY|nr:dicarboxylate/amino acid:cation symporter [Corynebacterium kutscheri]VEH05021.1 Na(+)/H(+)-dicarboxylate symporter family protein [Corynebacterium kutscheri]